MEGLPGYVLREPLGRGSAAVVWRAEPRGAPGRVVAVKRLSHPTDPGAVADLRREAEALKRLSHPSILRLLDVVDDGTAVALVLPLATGGSLADHIAASPEGLDARTVADLGARLASALAAAHNLGLVHRDVKPTNVLFDAEGQPLLADFGTARLLHDRAATAGTAEYLAPEVAAGDPPDAKSDVYSLGVTCYEALTGMPPFAGSSPAATLRAAARGDHVPLAEVVDAPASFVAAVETAMASDPSTRPGTAARFGALLDEARRELETAGGPATPPAGQHGAGVLGAVPPGARPATGEEASPSAAAATRTSGTGTAHERSGTQLFGPAPPRPTTFESGSTGLDRRLLVVAALLVLALPVAVAWWLVTSDDGAPEIAVEEPVSSAEAGAPSDSPGDPAEERTPSAPCDDVEPPAGAPETYPADVDGRGCSVPVGWDGGTLTVPRPDAEALRYELEATPADRLLFGDWTCDGAEAPALYRPATGEVFLFDGFTDDEVTVRGEPSGVLDGEPRVVADGEGCHQVDVEEP